MRGIKVESRNNFAFETLKLTEKFVVFTARKKEKNRICWIWYLQIEDENT